MGTPAPACKAALAQATVLWPNRSRLSDGIMGDLRHQQFPSDHNDGNAFDLTDDPAHGCDAHALVRELVARRDPRLKYVISRGQIWSALLAAKGWRRYTGENPHIKHAHVSITWAARGDTSPWWTQPAPRKAVVVNGYVDSLVAPNGGTWHLAADGGIFTDNDGLDGPQAPFYGSVPGVGGLGDTVAKRLLPHRTGYKVVVQHPDGKVSYFHFPAA